MTTIIVIVVVVLAILAIGAWTWTRRRHTEELREQFGPEYDRTVEQLGNRHDANVELERRAKRVETLNIVPLSEKDRERYQDSWQSVQAQFVDDPAAAVARADDLVAEVMQARGYPVGEFEQRAADISVDHPDVVENYRAAHAIALRQEAGEANTEDLRLATVHYRALFQSLLETPQPAETGR